MFKKLNVIVLSLDLLCIVNLINAQETIIDSIYSSPQLDGTIFFRESTQAFELNILGGEMFIGDYGMGINPDPNSRERGYISFQLPEIPEGYSIDSVLVRMKQYHSYGNNEPGVFPIWDVAGGDTMFCIMDHIDYGDELDIGDWTAGDPGDPQTLNTNIGIISDSPEIGFRFMNITEYVIDDYENGRDKTQYRIRFPIETDWDYWNDKIMLGQGAGSIGDPIIYVYFNQNNGIAENELGTFPQILKIYPNPFKSSVRFSLNCNTINIINNSLLIYNIKGQKIRELQIDEKDNIIWNGKDLKNNTVSSGFYFLKAESDNNHYFVKKIIKLK
jgi:hypothetical protein